MRVVFIGRHRTIPKRIGMYLATLGIARRVWLYRIGREVDGHEGLAMRHGLRALALMLPLAGVIAFASTGGAAGWSFLLASMVPGSVVALRTTYLVRDMLRGTMPFGHPLLVWLPTMVPVLGQVWYMAWIQSRLNRYWLEQKEHPEHGIEIDVGLADDPTFRAELGHAIRQSYFAGSRFDRARAKRWAFFITPVKRYRVVRERRRAARRAGIGTPLRPWAAPRRPARRLLHIRCGKCNAQFEAEHDPVRETPLVCPGCGQADVVPSIRSDLPGRREPVAIPAVKARCSGCKTQWHVLRSLDGPTPLKCPGCGRVDTLAPPGAAIGPAGGPATVGGSGAAQKRQEPGARPTQSAGALAGTATHAKRGSANKKAPSKRPTRKSRPKGNPKGA